MRYLIFNITVLAALGYLFTSAPNQSFTQWASVTLGGWGEAPSAPPDALEDDLVESGKTFARAVAKATGEQLERFDEQPNLTTMSEGSSHSESPEAVAIQPEPSLDAEVIRQLVLDAMEEADTKRTKSVMASAQPEAPTPEIHPAAAGLASVEMDLPAPAEKPEPATEISEQMSDAEIAAAFAAFEKTAGETPAKTETVGILPVEAVAEVAPEPVFMSPSERAEDISKIIQQLNLRYLEKMGI